MKEQIEKMKEQIELGIEKLNDEV